MKREQANILLIMTDQQRYDSLGCYGCKAVNTPNLDRLASEGVLFENCVVANPICTPSRASMWTGKDLPGHGVYRLYDNLHEDEVLFPVHLQKSGYRTGLFGKMHVSSMDKEAQVRHPNDGFDVYEWCNEASSRMGSEFHGYRKWLEEKNPELCARMIREGRGVKNVPQELHLTHWAAERTINFIENSGEQPWFACMSVFDPHNPYDRGPQKYMDKIKVENIPAPLSSDLGRKPEAHLRESHGGYMGDFQNFTEQDIIDMRRGYYSTLELLDDEVGRVFEHLEKNGQFDNTLIIFTSDHGDMLGDHQLMAKGAFFYDPCIKVPLIMRWPGKLQAGSRISAPVQNYDIASTVLNVAGLEADYDLIRAANGDQTALRNYVFCRYRNTGVCSGKCYWEPEIHATMIRNERWKLCYYHSSDEGELYDMRNDPDEKDNLWNNAKYSDIQAEFKKLLDEAVSNEEFERLPRGGETFPASVLMNNAMKTK